MLYNTYVHKEGTHALLEQAMDMNRKLQSEGNSNPMRYCQRYVVIHSHSALKSNISVLIEMNTATFTVIQSVKEHLKQLQTQVRAIKEHKEQLLASQKKLEEISVLYEEEKQINLLQSDRVQVLEEENESLRNQLRQLMAQGTLQKPISVFSSPIQQQNALTPVSDSKEQSLKRRVQFKEKFDIDDQEANLTPVTSPPMDGIVHSDFNFNNR